MLNRISIALLTLGLIFFTIKFLNSNRPMSIKTKTDTFSLSHYRSIGIKSKKEYFPMSINCENSEVGYLSFKIDAIVHSRFEKILTSKNIGKEVAIRQLKFFDGFVDHSSQNGNRLIPHEDKQIEILSVKKIKYPVDIYLDKVAIDTNHYPESFHNSWFRRGDEALQVTYKATVKTTRCSVSKGYKVDSYEIILPLDPYLAYWNVPKEKRIEVSVSSSYKITTTPCASEIMAELKYPNMYWNVWKPKAKTDDYDCSKLLKKNQHIKVINAKFTPIKPELKEIEFAHLKNKERIKISLINGLLLSIDTKLNLDRIRPLLKHINSIEDIKHESIKEQDYATLATFSFLNIMKNLTKNIDWKYEDNEDHFIFKTSGKLLHSDKPFDLEIYLGPTVEYQKGRRHWNFLANALQTSDFIFYSGHSGMGTTFSFENLKASTNFKGFKDSTKNQFIAILSCSSISYFGDDFIRERKKQGKVTDFLLTGFDNHAYRITPALIQYVDLKLAKKNYSLKSILKSHLGTNEDIHLTRD
jgi:hypothetical protein